MKLYGLLFSLFINNFTEAFCRLLDNFHGEEQKGKVSFFKRELPFGGEMDFDNTSYTQAERFVRAMYFPPYKGAYFGSKNHKKVEVKTTQELKKYKHLFKGVK